MEVADKDRTRVILRTVNSIYRRSYGPRDFMKVNEVAIRIFPDEPMLLEHLWFWGRFYRCKEVSEKNIGRPGVPYCAFNRNLLAIDKNVTREYRARLLHFAEQHGACLFKQICAEA